MYKKLCLFLIAILFTISTVALAVENQICGIGAMLLKDPYGKKTFIVGVLPNSPAQKHNLQVGDEILSVNNTKTKPLSLQKITEMIIGEEGSNVNILIKNRSGKTNYEITRAKVNIPQEPIDNTFDLHWKQVVPEGLENKTYIPDQVASKVSRDYYAQVVAPINYWAERKIGFKKGYDACMSYSKAEQNGCLMNLVNREIAKTDNDRQLEVQQQMARQQATQNFVNTMNQIQTNNNLNNINNSIQQQNFQIQNTNMQLQNTNMHLYNINNTLRGW